MAILAIKPCLLKVGGYFWRDVKTLNSSLVARSSFVKSIAILNLLLLSSAAFAQTAYKIHPQELCDGHPLVQVGTTEGTCLGLVADRSIKDSRSGETFSFPRKMVELAPGRFLVLDMGGWNPNKGSLWELEISGGSKKLWKLISGLDRPHGLSWGPDNNLYIGEVHRITRILQESLFQRNQISQEVVVDNLKLMSGQNMHPLINFTFGKSQADLGDLYVNMGAPSDACIKDAPYKCGFEGERGVVRKYSYQVGINQWNPQFEVLATGLRNSMGLVSHESGTLLQVENSRDFQEVSEPYDELNVVHKGKHYGWPYCYNFKGTSPEWRDKVDCAKGFEAPLVLLPPHSAPLDMIYYQGDMFPEWRGHLLVSLHGHKPTGSRLIAFPTDNSGLPLASNASTWEYSSGSTKQKAMPNGGNLRAAPFEEIVSSWQKRDAIRPAGTPVGILVASDGSIYMVEDKNKTIVRLAKTEKKVNQTEKPEDLDKEKKIKVEKALTQLRARPQMLDGFNWINQNVIQNNCTACHGDLKGSGTEAFEFMIGAGWLDQNSEGSLLIQRLRGLNGLQKMPLGGSLPDSHVDYIESWVNAL